MTQDVDLDLEVPTPSSGSRGSKRGCNYNHDEDIQLRASWMNVSNDPVVGNDQVGKPYWTRIADHYDENKTSDTERTASSVEHYTCLFRASCQARSTSRSETSKGETSKES
jgi:hypothetical protein